MISTEDLTAAIYQKISTAAVSATGGTHYQIAPEGVTAPYVVFSMISDTPTHTHEGEDGGVQRVQVDAYAATPELAAKIKDEIKNQLSGFSGQLANDLCGIIHRSSSFDAYEKETRLYRQSTDYRINYSEI